MPNQEIYCTVDNCHYWSQGNHCKANKILVASDQFSAQQPDSVDAPQASTMGPTPVNDCMDTSCKTFVDQNSGEIRSDGVTKRS